MKTTLMKIGLLAIAVGISAALCSFGTDTGRPELKTAVAMDDWTEWNKVNKYVREKVCKTVAEHEKGKSSLQMKNFSRCPSGYQPTLAGKHEDIRTDVYVTGTVEYYRGCSPKYVCDFKVCVNKDEAFLKAKDEKDFVAVNEWLKGKDCLVKN